MQSLLRRPILTSFGASAAIQGTNIATGVLLARVLGPAHRGELAAVILWPSLLATLGSIGIPDAATYVIARARASVGAAVGTAVALVAALSFLLVGVGFAVVSALLAQHDANARSAALLFLIFIPVNLVTLTLMGVISGLQRFACFNALRMCVVFVAAVLIVGLAAAHELTVTSAAVSYLAANTITMIAAGALVARLVKSRLTLDVGLARELIAFGAKSHTSSVSSLFNERLDLLVISVVLAPAQLGLYVIAGTLTSVTGLVGTSISVIAFPVLAGIRDVREQVRVTRRYLVLALGISLAVTLPLLIGADVLVRGFFGSAYGAASTPARILLVAALPLGIGRLLAGVLKATGKPLHAGAGDLIALAATVIALTALLPTLHLVGAALASLIAYSVSAAWMLRHAARSLGVESRELVVPRLGGGRLSPSRAAKLSQEPLP